MRSATGQVVASLYVYEWNPGFPALSKNKKSDLNQTQISISKTQNIMYVPHNIEVLYHKTHHTRKKKISEIIIALCASKI